MKLYILADRLNKSLDEVFKAIDKLNLNIKSPEQNLTHEEVMEITKYFAEKRRFLFFILLWGYILSFLSAFSFLFKKRDNCDKFRRLLRDVYYKHILRYINN